MSYRFARATGRISSRQGAKGYRVSHKGHKELEVKTRIHVKRFQFVMYFVFLVPFVVEFNFIASLRRYATESPKSFSF
jgi:hypothetical protein